MKRTSLAKILAISSFLVVAIGSVAADADPAWKFWGGGLDNNHHAASETTIGPENVWRLVRKKTYWTTGSVSAIPTSADDILYFPDWGPPYVGGSLFLDGSRIHAVNRHTGWPVWSRRLSDIDPEPINRLSRTSPAIAGDLIVIGNAMNIVDSSLGAPLEPKTGAYLYALNRHTGALVWKTQLDPHWSAQVTQSPTVYDGRVYVGVSSQESTALIDIENKPCCTFRGNMNAVDLETGEIIWKRYTVPENGGQPGGFPGASVWGSSPAIDPERGLVYVGTGNNYDAPETYKECLRNNVADPELQRTECHDVYDPPENHNNSLLALELDTGNIRWARKFVDYDAWNTACVVVGAINTGRCPDPAGPDADFAQAPMLITVEIDGQPRDLVVAGQKSGTFWAVDPDDGEVVWSTKVGPGGVIGGMEFGAATDGERIYTQITNLEHTSFTLVAGPDAGETINGGIWAALDPATGEILWQTADPSSRLPLVGTLAHEIWGSGLGQGFFALAMGPMTVANGVVYAGSLAGYMYALHAETGEVLWSYDARGSVMSAPTVIDGRLYWGSGYHLIAEGNRLYTFGLRRLRWWERLQGKK